MEKRLGFHKGHPVPLWYPMEAVPTGPTSLIDPCVGFSHGLPTPTYPGDDGFNDELEESLDVRRLVSEGIWPADYLDNNYPGLRSDGYDAERVPEPLALWGMSSDDPHAASMMVEMDRPWHFIEALLDWLDMIGAPTKTGVEYTEFGEASISPMETALDCLKQNHRLMMEAKYYFGRVRIETVLGVHGSVLTPYRNGCPPHPAYPGGHAALAAAARVLPRHRELKDWMWNEIKASVWVWSSARVMSLMHYTDDNVQGIALGGLNMKETAEYHE